MRKELSHHTMSARSRTAACPRERGWSRAVPEVLCERPLPNRPVHSRTRTRTRSFGLSHGLCSVFPMISDLFRARILERFQVCDRLSFVSPHVWLHFFTHKRIPASPESRSHGKRWSLLARHTSRLVSFVDYPSQVSIRATTAPRRRRSAEQPHGSFVTVKTQASSRPSGHRARVIFRVPPLLVFPCSARQAQHAHAVFARMSDHGPPNPQFLSTSFKDRRQLQLFQRLALRRGRASFCDICQPTSSRPPFAGLSVAPWNKDDVGDGVPTDQLSHNHCDCIDSHCNSHIVTSCVFVLVLHSHHKSIGGRLLLLPQRNKVARASPDRWDHGAPTGQRGPPGREGNVFVHTPITRPAA